MPLSAAAVDSQRVRLDAFRMRYGGGEGDYGTPRRIPRLWGARRNETERHYPCDDLSGGPGEAWFRAVTVDADRPSVFRWLCQLKVAPYNYDLLDNSGAGARAGSRPARSAWRDRGSVCRVHPLQELGGRGGRETCSPRSQAV